MIHLYLLVFSHVYVVLSKPAEISSIPANVSLGSPFTILCKLDEAFLNVAKTMELRGPSSSLITYGTRDVEVLQQPHSDSTFTFVEELYPVYRQAVPAITATFQNASYQDAGLYICIVTSEDRYVGEEWQSKVEYTLVVWGVSLLLYVIIYVI